MALGDLTTLDTALAWLHLDNDENDTITRLISAISTQTQQFVSYAFASQGYDRFFNGRGSRSVSLPDSPITAVELVELWGRPVPPRAGTIPGFVFDENRVMVDAPYVFDRAMQNVRIKYTAGYATTPADVEQAVLMWLKATLDTQENGANVSELRAGDHQIKYANTANIGRGFIVPMPVQVYAILQPYQRVIPV
jgi:hypothetical protein